jgi:lysophospholipase L1-like esterase
VNPANERSRQRPPATILELNTWLRSFCARRNFTYVDYFPALADQAGMLGAELADDGLHPNAKGYRLMAPVALAAIDSVLKPEPAGKKKRK